MSTEVLIEIDATANVSSDYFHRVILPWLGVRDIEIAFHQWSLPSIYERMGLFMEELTPFVSPPIPPRNYSSLPGVQLRNAFFHECELDAFAANCGRRNLFGMEFDAWAACSEATQPSWFRHLTKNAPPGVRFTRVQGKRGWVIPYEYVRERTQFYLIQLHKRVKGGSDLLTYIGTFCTDGISFKRPPPYTKDQIRGAN